MNIFEKITELQLELKVGKTSYNKFGNFYYRKEEDILTAVKPLLGKYKLLLNMSDSVRLVGERYYIEATATVYDLENLEMVQAAGNNISHISSTAYAREAENKKGMDDSQVTGTATTYARKQSLCGLFALDDGGDADDGDNASKDTRQPQRTQGTQKDKSSGQPTQAPPGGTGTEIITLQQQEWLFKQLTTKEELEVLKELLNYKGYAATNCIKQNELSSFVSEVKKRTQRR